ncbi:uncharacterized protein LACBIDRAFT_293779 [Laccaria bicolor S238N-H82]|uniref:Predicted protein n=1 Tax=Laccaria bicolor (strain S238N-H82 / ATCC MYA-4686) TaxID=486041 RepID=B0D6I4_LACBS|nr:uncharacterized protein LACBIDRAFT_293779 [Laccaria bicolor S238N-H82]EDR10192.1 predicted protein [Laccaria bicolor S238N-H82]|eukprot:XP_001879577.1 predicted protein [Laccaria bicolor S238N-H82]
MPKRKKFWCILLDDPVKQPFFVENRLDDVILALLSNVKSTLPNGAIAKYDPYQITLYKITKSIPVEPSNNLFERIKNMGDIRTFSTQLDNIAAKLSGIFTGGVNEQILQFAIKLPQAPEDSEPPLKRARLTSSEVPIWLQELHKKIWNRGDLHQELFRSVTLTLQDYETLQASMTKLYPNRKEKNYQAGIDGLATKLALLRSSNNHPVTDHGPDGVTQPTHHDDDEFEDDDEVDEELRSLFPFPLEYLDLSSLHLESPPPRMPQPLLIREDYTVLSRLLDDLPEGGNGSAVISGQPGTGKTAYLYYILIQSMLAGTRCLFQTVETEAHDTIYLIDSSVEVVNFWPDDEYIIAFFDADGPSSRPAHFLLNHHFVKIIATCSPNNAYQEWIEKPISPNWVSRRITTLWSPQELFLTGMFLAPPDLSYSRLQELTSYFGFNPRDCFHAPPSITEVTARIAKNIEECSRNMHLEEFWLSPWALTTLLKIYKKGQVDAPYEFYKILKKTPGTGRLRGEMFEAQVLEYFVALKGPETFTIRSSSSSEASQWTYPGPTTNTFSYSSTFTQSLRDAVTKKESLPLVPQRNFPVVDSILYTPGDVLTGIQVTVNTDHTAMVVGLQRIQETLKKICIMANLRPSIQVNHWRLIFVVPEDTAPLFEIQKFEGDGLDGWLKKVDHSTLCDWGVFCCYVV